MAVVLDPDMPTQYASSAQNPLVQSDEMAGFQARNSALVMPNSASTTAQVSFASGVGFRILGINRVRWYGGISQLTLGNVVRIAVSRDTRLGRRSGGARRCR